MVESTNQQAKSTPEPLLTVGQWVAHYPQTARVFERRGIDYCCGGKRTLEEACARNGKDAGALRAELAEILQAESPAMEVDWNRKSIAALIDHIESAHHGYIRVERPRLTALAHKVARVHGSRHPELSEISSSVDRLFQVLEAHLEQEERVFFPACRKWEKAGSGIKPDIDLLDHVEGVEEDHLEVGQILERIRGLTSGFVPPEDACNSYLALFHGLEQLEADLHMHIHLENNVLHARLAAISATLPREESGPQAREAQLEQGRKTVPEAGAAGSCCEA